MNCIILGRAEMFASKNAVGKSALDGIGMGLGFTFALIIMAVIREVIGSGTILGYDITFGVYEPAMMIAQPAGAFITLGFIIAVVQKIKNSAEDKKRFARLSKAEPKERKDKK